MNLALRICFLLACAACYVVQTVYFTHMLQLNSYRPERYGKWCRENPGRLFFIARLLPLGAAALLFVPPERIGYGAAMIVLAVTAFLCRPKKAKKPLVITARVKRLWVTAAVLLAALLTGLYFAGISLLGAVLTVLTASLAWIWVGVANLLNLPVEKGIARHYVNDARRILRAMPGLIVIGITGSYGKTSAKNFLYTLLSSKYNVLMTPESYNTTMGVVRTIREQLRPYHEIFIVEMGAKNPGDIREICELVRPKYGILTAIGEQHLETFKTIDNIIRTKFELADAIPADGAVFLNFDNLHIRQHKTACRVISYGTATETGAMVLAGDAAVGPNGSTFTITLPDGESGRFSTRLLGAHNIQNLTGCIAVADTLGIGLEALVYPVRQIRPVKHRLELLPGGFIDDAYNANPAGFRAALDVLKGFAGQRVLVTPGMVELGERQAALNRELGAYAADCCDYSVLVGFKQAPPLKEGLLSAGFPEERLFVADTLQEGLAFVRGLPAEGMRTVLLENDLPDNF